jgi:hypothetical protein
MDQVNLLFPSPLSGEGKSGGRKKNGREMFM